MKPLPTLGLVAAAVAITIAFEESRIAALRGELAAKTSAPANADRSRSTGPGTADSAEPMAATKAGERAATPDREKEEPADQELGKTVRKMWDNPAGKAMMNQGVKIAVTMMYEDFIGSLDLTKEEAEYFKTLLGKGMADQQEIGMKMLNATPAERTELAKEIEDRKKAFLNSDDDHKRYTDYQNRLPERQQLDGLRATFSSKGTALDKATEDRLVEAMYQARTTAKAPDFSGPDALSEMSKGNFTESFEKSWEVQDQAVMKEVGSILDGPQLEAFKEYRKQAKEMQLMGMKMAEKMMQGEKEE
jgi:hypothetical protein